MCNLIKTCTLLFDVALITVALQHCFANRSAPGPPTPRGVLEACLYTAPALDRGGRRRSQAVVCLIVYIANSAETQFLRRPEELAAGSFTALGQRGLPGRRVCWGQGEARLLSVSGLAPRRGLSPVVALLRLPPLRSLLPLHAGWTQAVEYPEHLLPAHAASLRLHVAAPPLGPPGPLGRVGNRRRPIGAWESCGGGSGAGGSVVLPGVETALAKAIVLHAEGEEAAGRFALHGVSFAV